MADLRSRVGLRSKVTHAARAFFHDRGFLEVETPTMVASPGMEPHLRAFPIRATEALEVDGRWLRTSPEYAIKATLADVGEDVFTFARSYRDEPPSRWHHPEFTMVEWYRLGVDHRALMDDCEALLRAVGDVLGLDVLTDFHRWTVADAFDEAVGRPPEAPASELAAALRRRGIDVDPEWDHATLFSLTYTQLVEPALPNDRPTFLHSFPAEMAALARLNPDDPSVADRFELYVPGKEGPIELANAFSELLDPDEQRSRFIEETNQRSRDGATVYPMPEALLSGIARLDSAAGIALGFERLLVWLAERRHGWRTSVADWLLGEPH